MSNPSISADKTPWYQWDTGLTVTVSGGEMTECHFANRKQGTAYVQAVINGVARVPDELLQVAYPIKAYGYVSDGAGGQTYVEKTFEVIARNIPADYTYTKTAQKTIRDAEAARDEAVKAAKDAKASELAADDSAVESSNSAQSAGESASAAANSASNAAKSAGEAAKSASDAKAAASKTVEDASKLLKTYTDNAKTSADNAATSARNAADAASSASGSASAAEQSATDASNAKAAAQTAKAEAATSASNAATSASNAESSATAAAKSASDAAASVGAINVIAPKTVEATATAEGYKALSIGDTATAVGQGSVAIGYKASSAGSESIAIGDTANASEPFAVALGELSTASAGGSIAAGYNSIANNVNEFSIGNNNLTREITHVSTPTANTSASTKKYTDDNDVKTLSEAKKYTDANTSNALVGNVSGKLLHVEDAWPSPVREFVVYGKSVQDGTPTPDAPVLIESVSELSVTACGKNLIKYPYSDTTKIEKGITFTDIGDGSISVEGTNTSDNGSPFNLVGKRNDEYYIILPAGTYTAYAKESSNNGTIYLSIRGDNYYGKDVLGNFAIDQLSRNKKFTISEPTKLFIRIGVLAEGTVAKTTVNVSLCASEDTDPYLPYIGSTTPNLLVSEDGTAYELRSLPDGTRDELVVRDGRRVLHMMTGRTSKAVADGVTGTVGTDVISSTGEIADGADVVFKLSDPLTIDLGPADQIKIPETISNVWVEANLTPECAMTYRRDINIAFDNLVQAVVAAAAGE